MTGCGIISRRDVGMRQGGSDWRPKHRMDAKKAKGGRRSEWVGIGCLNLGEEREGESEPESERRGWVLWT